METTFADRLRRLLDDHGEKQPMAARRLGYTHAWLNRVINGDRPSREFVERVADVYKADREELLTLAGFNRTPYEDPVVRATENAAGRLADAIAAVTVERLLAAQGSPKERLYRQLGAIAAVCLEHQVDLPAAPVFRGGSESLSHEQADEVVRIIAGDLVAGHPELEAALRGVLGDVMEEG